MLTRCGTVRLSRRVFRCRRASTEARPISWIYFPRHLPYELALAVQEQLVSTRLEALSQIEADPDLSDPVVREVADTDVLLLLQHRPVYTTGRRDTDQATLEREGERLRTLGADYIATSRGGQTTYHGPGQLVGYPIFNMGATGMRTRGYVCLVERFLDNLLAHYQIPVTPSPHVGTFTSPNHKIASIGIQIRHRVTSHGFALNVEDSVLSWFGNIVACGLSDVQATSMNRCRREQGIQGDDLAVEGVVEEAARQFGLAFGRIMQPFAMAQDHPLSRAILPALQ